MTSTAAWGLCYLLVVATAAAANNIIGARQLTVGVWFIGAFVLFGWSLRAGAKLGAFGTSAGVFLGTVTAILALGFFGYCGFTILVIVWEALGLGH